jgi:hypothetical protein
MPAAQLRGWHFKYQIGNPDTSSGSLSLEQNAKKTYGIKLSSPSGQT